MAEFEPINTQEEFDKRISERIKRERDHFESKYSDYEKLKEKAGKVDSLQEQLDAMTAEKTGLASKLESMKTAFDADIAAAKRETTKLRVASELNIPSELAARLQGDDEDAIRKDAEKVAGFLATKKPAPPLKSNEPEPKNDKDAGLLNTLRELKGEN